MDNETRKQFKARVSSWQRRADTRTAKKRIRDAEHLAIPFLMGNRVVRKRVYFRWCVRRGLDPTDMANVKNFRRRRQWQRDHSELARITTEAIQIAESMVKEVK